MSKSYTKIQEAISCLEEALGTLPDVEGQTYLSLASVYIRELKVIAEEVYKQDIGDAEVLTSNKKKLTFDNLLS